MGKTAFVAVNLIFPFILLPSTLGTIFGTGGSALVARTLGKGLEKLASRRFSLLVYTGVCAGALLGLVWMPFLETAAAALGAEGEVLEACLVYGRILIPGLPFMIAQCMFQGFFSLAEKPRLGLVISIVAGLTNVVLDVLFIIVFGWGLTGAALATVAGMLAGSVPALVFFARRGFCRLRLGRATFELNALIRSCANGASEFMTNVSTSLVAMLYNYQLLRVTGENGVAAYGIIMYVSFIFVSVLLGYALGSIPVVGYQFGARRRDELKNVLAKSIVFNGVAGVLLTVAAVLLAEPLAVFFVGYDKEVLAMTEQACFCYAFSFLFAGFNIFASSFFTGLNNGLVSAVIAFARTLVFEVLAVLLLPVFFGVHGIWIACAVAEACALVVSIFCVVCLRRQYGYL